MPQPLTRAPPPPIVGRLDKVDIIAYEDIGPTQAADTYATVCRCKSTGRDITICYNTYGCPDDPCMLLIMGLNCPGPYWDTRFCTILADAGFYVIRYDNRDSGLSTRFDDLAAPSLLRLALPRWASIGEVRLPYSIDDMADDAAGLLDHLGVRQASVVGCSMGGMVAQSLVLRFPARVRSLCLLSTSSGAPRPQPHIMLGFFDSPKDDRPESIVEYKVRNFRALAGRLPFPLEEFRVTMRWTVDRSPYEGGYMRHMTAIARSPDRAGQLSTRLNRAYRAAVAPEGRGLMSIFREVARTLRGRFHPADPVKAAEERQAVEAARRAEPFIPVLVLHGGSDPIIPVANAHRLSELIPGARLVVFPEMGHYFPSMLFDGLAQEIILNARHGEALA